MNFDPRSLDPGLVNNTGADWSQSVGIPDHIKGTYYLHRKLPISKAEIEKVRNPFKILSFKIKLFRLKREIKRKENYVADKIEEQEELDKKITNYKKQGKLRQLKKLADREYEAKHNKEVVEGILNGWLYYNYECYAKYLGYSDEKIERKIHSSAYEDMKKEDKTSEVEVEAEPDNIEPLINEAQRKQEVNREKILRLLPTVLKKLYCAKSIQNSFSNRESIDNCSKFEKVTEYITNNIDNPNVSLSDMQDSLEYINNGLDSILALENQVSNENVVRKK